MSEPCSQPGGRSARASGGTQGGAKNMDDVVPPSMCRSTYRRPSTVTGMRTGGKNPGIDADASSTLRNRSRLSGVPRDAIAPMSHTIARRASRESWPATVAV